MLIGYIITLVTLASFVLMLAFAVRDRRDLSRILKFGINRYSAAALVIIVLLFALIALLFIHPVEQLYFDENIYQGVALNILHSGNALWCQYGTGYLQSCYVNQLYHDIVGYDVFIAVTFALFGAGAQTAYALQLFAGIISIIGVFLLVSVLSDRKEVAVFSAAVFASIPELFIWVRTQAAPDVPFMMFTIISSLFFVVLAKKPSFNKMMMFFMSLILVVYTREEGLLLIPAFALLYIAFGNSGIRRNAKDKISIAKHALSEPLPLIGITVFILFLMPILYYSALELQSPSYGNSSNQALFSLANFENNIQPNIGFITATSDTVYPEVPSALLVPLAVVGAIAIAFYGKWKNRFGMLLLLGVLAFSYFIFYPFFYAGAYNYGVDVRFVLETLPFVAVLSGFGIFGIGAAIIYLIQRMVKRHVRTVILSTAVYSVLLATLVVYPFYVYAPKITIPSSQMPQESYPSNATSFFYSNYNAVPSNCLVFSFTPDLWYEYNRSAAQIGYLSSANQSVSESFKQNYSCYVFDYDYWCTVPPYQDTLCSNIMSKYNTSVIASQSNGRGSYFAFYRLLNYSP